MRLLGGQTSSLRRHIRFVLLEHVSDLVSVHELRSAFLLHSDNLEPINAQFHWSRGMKAPTHHAEAWSHDYSGNEKRQSGANLEPKAALIENKPVISWVNRCN